MLPFTTANLHSPFLVVGLDRINDCILAFSAKPVAVAPIITRSLGSVFLSSSSLRIRSPASDIKLAFLFSVPYICFHTCTSMQVTGRSFCTPSWQPKEKKNHQCTLRVLVRASSHVLYLISIAESTEPKQVYGVKLDFVSERIIKDIIIIGVFSFIIVFYYSSTVRR